MKTSLRSTLAILCGLALSAATTRGTTLSGPIVNPANGHTYFLLSQNTWTASEAEAVSLGGHLATINDAAEDSFVFGTFSPIVLPLAPVSFTSLWIGLNDAAIEGTFVWVSGESSPYINWHPGNPQGTFADEDYVGIVVNPAFGTPGLWHDIVSDSRLGDVVFGVVEVPVPDPSPGPIPEPSTLILFTVGILGIMGMGYRQRKKVA
ncbi:PEP-CTERM sorting domain-containing protein [Candidatus Poribacteria bacterium]|nr:PEP-CTERM sorting domain-containing protein [Candidatus Poribacteria bacterium]